MKTGLFPGPTHRPQPLSELALLGEIPTHIREQLCASCREYLIIRRAYELWQHECRRMDGIVHGQHQFHWQQSEDEFARRHPHGLPTEVEFIAYMRHMAIRERAYCYHELDINSKSGQFGSNREEHWIRAEKEIDAESTVILARSTPSEIGYAGLYRFLSWQYKAQTDSKGREKKEPHVTHTEKIEAARKALEEMKGPFAGLSEEEVQRKYAGQKLALDASRKIIGYAPTEELLREKMKDYPGKWRLHPGWPKGGRLKVPSNDRSRA